MGERLNLHTLCSSKLKKDRNNGASFRDFHFWHTTPLSYIIALSHLFWQKDWFDSMRFNLLESHRIVGTYRVLLPRQFCLTFIIKS